MGVRVLAVDPADPPPERVAEAVRALRAGEIVALPTETFYGLAVDPFRTGAVARLNGLKGKAAGAPALLLLADRAQARLVAGDLPAAFETLAGRFWPGPLTLVVPASERLPAGSRTPAGTVGVRVSGAVLPRRVAAALELPVTGVSANVHGEPPCRTAAEVARAFPEGLGLVLDGGPAPGGAPSTLVDLCGAVPRILRAGAIPPSAIRRFLPDLSD